MARAKEFTESIRVQLTAEQFELIALITQEERQNGRSVSASEVGRMALVEFLRKRFPEEKPRQSSDN